MKYLLALLPLLQEVYAAPEPKASTKPECTISNGVGTGCKAPARCIILPGISCIPEGPCPGYCQKPECGSRGLPGCKDGYHCIAFPGASCGPEADCGGYCVKDQEPSCVPVTKTKTKTVTKTKTTSTSSGRPTPIDCGGFRPNPPQCPVGQICKIPPSSICFNGTVTDCAGLCVGQVCGGNVRPPNPECPQGQVCVRRPSDPPADVVADLPGICVFEDLTCGTKGSRVPKNGCPRGWNCVDDERDSCFPDQGAKDCQGLCSFNRTTSGDAGGDGPKPSKI